MHVFASQNETKGEEEMRSGALSSAGFRMQLAFLAAALVLQPLLFW